MANVVSRRVSFSLKITVIKIESQTTNDKHQFSSNSAIKVKLVSYQLPAFLQIYLHLMADVVYTNVSQFTFSLRIILSGQNKSQAHNIFIRYMVANTYNNQV